MLGENTQNSLVKGVHTTVVRLIAGIGTQTARYALEDSTGVSEDMVQYLKENNWAPNGVMTLKQVAKFL